jgi:UDP-glucose 4-epimerase
MTEIKNALVTGAAGFIGRPLVRRLTEKGIKVLAVDRNSLALEGCKSLILDISDPGVLDEYVDQDTVIFHLAAKASVQESVIDPAGDFKNTCYGMFQILETARRSKCKVIFPSTASIYDPNNDLPVSERSFVKPSSPYGAAKVAGEAYCAVYHRCYGVDVRIARMFSVYGCGMNRFAIHDIIRNIQKDSKMLPLLGDGTQIRDYLYIDDVIEGLYQIATTGSAGEDYNLASGEGISILKLAETISSLMGYPNLEIKSSGESFPGDVPKWFGDISKISNIGFKQTVSLKDGLNRTIKWLTDN